MAPANPPSGAGGAASSDAELARERLLGELGLDDVEEQEAPDLAPHLAGDAPEVDLDDDPEPVAAAAVEIDLDLARLAQERDDYLDALRRLQADFDNYRKRMIRQQTENLDRAAEGLVEKLLPVLDTSDLALAHQEGYEQALTSLSAVLEKEGLERIQPDGEPFDPNEHDAVAHEAAAEGDADVDPHVAEVMRPGYRWKGRVLRPAMVKVKG